MNQSINWLNELSADDAEAEFLKCCSSRRWSRLMTEARPFVDSDELFTKGKQIWWQLDAEDWLEAFRAHPKIGEQKATAVNSQAQNWSAQEQSGVAKASVATMGELAQRNRDYEDCFGFIFIVCATGKTPEEMLASLNERLQNDASTELRIAAAEQNKITRLRLEKLLNQ